MTEKGLKYLADIMRAIELIKEFTSTISLYSDYVKDLKTQSAVERQLGIIGEAVKNLPKEMTNKYPYIPWKDIVGTRDKVIHQYFDVDLDILWEVIEKNIPDLKQNILKIKEDIEEENKKDRTKRRFAIKG